MQKKQSNPDIYMPWNWPKFWQAVHGQPEHVIIAYQKLITYYWFHNHCKGIPNDDLHLRCLCVMEHRQEWPQVKQVLFESGEFMTKVNGLWHQLYAKGEWDRTVEAMQKRQEQTSAARQKLKKTICTRS